MTNSRISLTEKLAPKLASSRDQCEKLSGSDLPRGYFTTLLQTFDTFFVG